MHPPLETAELFCSRFGIWGGFGRIFGAVCSGLCAPTVLRLGLPLRGNRPHLGDGLPFFLPVLADGLVLEHAYLLGRHRRLRPMLRRQHRPVDLRRERRKRHARNAWLAGSQAAGLVEGEVAHAFDGGIRTEVLRATQAAGHALAQHNAAASAPAMAIARARLVKPTIICSFSEAYMPRYKVRPGSIGV